MIRCIQIGSSIVQGEVTAQDRTPVRKRPAYELEIIDIATIGGMTGPLIPTFRRRCGECRQIHGQHLDWCPERE